MMDDTLLLRYLNGELDQQTTAAVADRLRRDPALQRRAEELRAVEDAYCSKSENEEPDRRNAVDENTTRREELIDEALRETFPASDPPFWMP